MITELGCASDGNIGLSREEMQQVREALDPVLDRKPNLKVSARVGCNHGNILRKDFRAIADAVRQTAAAHDQERR